MKSFTPIHRFLTPDDKNDLELFCRECRILGYENNISLLKMKYDTATWTGTYIDDLLVSVSGIRPEPDIEKHAYRVLFRGCTLPGYVRQLSKSIDKASYQWDGHLPLQLKSVNNARFYMTSNVNGGAKSYKFTKYMNYMVNKGHVRDCGTKLLFNTYQRIYEINIRNN
tara:strand:+ start:524 stop:1027 length:504 start_codon:yes stop_codon:yes gene_type:complete